MGIETTEAFLIRWEMGVMGSGYSENTVIPRGRGQGQWVWEAMAPGTIRTPYYRSG